MKLASGWVRPPPAARTSLLREHTRAPLFFSLAIQSRFDLRCCRVRGVLEAPDVKNQVIARRLDAIVNGRRDLEDRQGPGEMRSEKIDTRREPAWLPAYSDATFGLNVAKRNTAPLGPIRWQWETGG